MLSHSGLAPFEAGTTPVLTNGAMMITALRAAVRLRDGKRAARKERA
jgi:hypothetical protein